MHGYQLVAQQLPAGEPALLQVRVTRATVADRFTAAPLGPARR